MPIDYGNHSVNTNGTIAGSGMVMSDPSLVANSTHIVNVVVITQADYDNLASYDSTTLYVITD